MSTAKAPATVSVMEATLESFNSAEWQQFLIDSLKHISTPLARKMLAQIGLDDTTREPFKLLENGCGMGVVAPVLNDTIPQDVLKRCAVLCGDVSEKLVEVVKGRIEREGWVGVEARVVDAQRSGFPSESFTHVVSNIMYHTVPDSKAALKDSIRLVQPGGTLALTTWHTLNGGWVPDVRAAFSTLPSSLLPSNYHFHLPMQTTSYGHWDDVNWIRRILIDQGLQDVKVDVLAHLNEMNGPDHFMRCFAAMIEWAAKANLGEEVLGERGSGMMDEVKECVRRYLVEGYGESGRWNLTWVSIIASGRKQS